MKFQTAILSTSLFLWNTSQAASQTIRATVIAVNEAPDFGTCLSPVWFGVHDGSFDIYDRLAPTSPALERLAEDGNAAPLSDFFLQQPGGVLDGTFQGALCPGETQYFQIELDASAGIPLYFSYASMILPSNDAFVANGSPVAHPIIDGNGNFVDVSILDTGVDVLDAGTEVNDEIPENTAFFGQMAPDTGMPTPGGVIDSHPGFNPPGSEGILDDPRFSNADFLQEGYNVVRIQVVLDVEYSGTVRVQNTAPELGTCQTPVWVGIHDGQFDSYDRNEPSTPALERIAEDGNALPLVEDFAGNPGGFWDGVVGSMPFCSGAILQIPFSFRAPLGVPLYFSYVTMVVPSNDAFLANGNPRAFEVVNMNGEFIPVVVQDFGVDVLDAGTELNDEIPMNTAFFGQTTPDSGIPENGVIVAHPGLNPVGSGGVLDDPRFANADFLAQPDYKLLTIEVFVDNDGGDGEEQPMMGNTISDLAAGNPNFSILVAALERVGLVDILRSPGPFTVFAPTNSAFDGIDLDALSDEELTNILLYHVVQGAFPRSALQTGTLISLNRRTDLLAIATLSIGTVFVEGVRIRGNGAMASNGYVLTIDEVLIPPVFETPPPNPNREDGGVGPGINVSGSRSRSQKGSKRRGLR